ncbi:hypothetical protein [Bradyrhizobium sp. USDA 3315]
MALTAAALYLDRIAAAASFHGYQQVGPNRLGDDDNRGILSALRSRPDFPPMLATLWCEANDSMMDAGGAENRASPKSFKRNERDPTRPRSAISIRASGHGTSRINRPYT